MPKVKDRVSIPVSLPIGLVHEIDEMVEQKLFGSRSEVLRYGARLAVIYHKRIHERAEEYALGEVKEGLERGRKISRY
ncbi:MAG: ribbon-helix-helix domain-containing protein [Thermoplasmatota archaeon]